VCSAGIDGRKSVENEEQGFGKLTQKLVIIRIVQATSPFTYQAFAERKERQEFTGFFTPGVKIK